jgi:hypothetical protein
MDTARIAKPISGNELYQQRARAALPVLVRQARAAAPIYYSDLATELGMPNARNLNYVLGSIGQALKRLSKQWSERIPPIQCIVVNKHTGLPGEGISWFISDKEDFRKLPRWRQRRIVKAELERVFAFTRWPEVLTALGLKALKKDYRSLLRDASNLLPGGESEHHLRLKAFVAANPGLFGLPKGLSGTKEHRLPSGDCVDVFFEHGDQWVAIEVKSRLSPEPDIMRGIFQCVKYRAVIEAQQASLEIPQDTKAVLVLEDRLPDYLVPLKNILNVQVIDRVRPR